MKGLAALAGSATFRHGVHPAEMKQLTEGLAIERMPFVDEYVLPLSQHTGAPSRPLVGPGMRVKRGQMIAAADGFISTALHAPVTGTVEAVELRPHPNGQRMLSVVIRTDPFSSQRVEASPQRSVEDLSVQEVARKVQEAGIVGLGGAAFPSHVKLQLPEGKQAKFVILNGCECEPYLTCDHRIMVDRPATVLRGLRLIMRQLGAERGYVGVEMNKPDAIEALRAHAAQFDDVEIVPLKVKYPRAPRRCSSTRSSTRRCPAGSCPSTWRSWSTTWAQRRR